MINFWQNLSKPFIVLAPMEDVTDFVFREIVATKLPRPDVFFTEFTSADGLVSPGFKRVSLKLKYSENQRPIVAQLWGREPQKMFEAAKIVQEMGFDGLDLNMGCPERNLVRRGCGAGLIGDPETAARLIESAQKGAPNLPISVKTRIGIKQSETEKWITHILRQGVENLTVHGRVAKQMSNGLANWEEIAKAVAIRNEIAPETVLVGNGDVKNIEDAKLKHLEFGVDGAMIGRGIFHDPWAFGEKNEDPLEVLLAHAKLFEETWGKTKNFEILKKFFKMYVKDFDGASQLRIKLMEVKNYSELAQVLDRTF